jgi:hypothetical protein
VVEEIAVKKAKKVVKKQKTENSDAVVEEAVEAQAMKVPKVKAKKVANADFVPEEKAVVEVKAPKKAPKEVRAEKAETKDKATAEVARSRAKKALVDARMRMSNTPVVLEFN